MAISDSELAKRTLPNFVFMLIERSVQSDQQTAALQIADHRPQV
jgi:hypothetical protein